MHALVACVISANFPWGPRKRLLVVQLSIVGCSKHADDSTHVLQLASGPARVITSFLLPKLAEHVGEGRKPARPGEARILELGHRELVT